MTRNDRSVLDRRRIATFAKHMVCPPALGESPTEVVNKRSNRQQGAADFERYPYRHDSLNYVPVPMDTDDEMLRQVSEAIIRTVPQDKKPLLLLSDGKDSMTLALAFQTLGVACDTLTFLRDEDDALRAYVDKVATSLGHTPHFVSATQILSAYDESELLEAAKRMANPVLDQGFLYFLFGLRVHFRETGADPSSYCVVDGLGNDEYLGYIPSPKQYKSLRLSRMSLWRLVPSSQPRLRWYFRSPAESHGDLSALAAFFPIARSHRLNDYFRELPNVGNPFAVVDFRAFARGSFHDHQCMIQKTVVAAEYLGASVAFPWVDKALACFCFNLPVSQKFDFSNLTNKLCLRRILSERIEWNQTKRGIDMFFDLDWRSLLQNSIVPASVRSRIQRTYGLPVSVRRRAALEALNYFAYCLSHGMSTEEATTLLTT